jgi:hypothetical protein
MQISGGRQYPWIWPAQAGSSTAAGDPSSSAQTKRGTDGGGAAAAGPDGAVQSFDAMLQSMILQLQSDANGSSGEASTQPSTTSSKATITAITVITPTAQTPPAKAFRQWARAGRRPVPPIW